MECPLCKEPCENNATTCGRCGLSSSEGLVLNSVVKEEVDKHLNDVVWPYGTELIIRLFDEIAEKDAVIAELNKGKGGSIAENSHRIGNDHYYGRNGVPQCFVTAAKQFATAAKYGYAPAQNDLAYMLDKGEGVVQNAVEAMTWYKRAAEQGHSVAQYNLALKYDKGQGVDRSHLKAIKWYQKAAEQGHSKSQHNLGLMYEQGQGVPSNFSEALRLFQLSAEQGHEEAKKSVIRIEQKIKELNVIT